MQIEHINLKCREVLRIGYFVYLMVLYYTIIVFIIRVLPSIWWMKLIQIEMITSVD